MPDTELNVGYRVMTTANILIILTGVLAREKDRH